MGLFESLFGRKKKEQKRASAAVAPTNSARVPRQTRKNNVATPTPGNRSRWIGAGEAIKVNGFIIPGGMIYVGTELRAANGTADPSLINPNLEIRKGRVIVDGNSIDYWPSYSEVAPEVRTGYLAWLSQGRRNPEAPIGVVFLFVYGLERRVLIDIANDRSLAPELAPIRQEMSELLELYGNSSNSFGGYAPRFIDFIDAVSTLHGLTPPSLHAPSVDRTFTPFPLRAALGQHAASGRAIPAELAFHWAWHHPENSLRTPARRCQADLSQLFNLRFVELYPAGLPTKPGKTRLKVSYQPASAGLRETTVTFADTPDIFQQAVPDRRLIELFQRVMSELDPYSRWIGKNPGDRGSLPAIALLPRELIPGASRSVSALHAWITSTLGDGESVSTSARDLTGHWPTAIAGKLSKSESTSLAQLLGALDIGIEPDPRFGGPALTDELSVTLFRTDRQAPQAPSPSYSAASTLIHLAVATAIADGDLSHVEIAAMQKHLESSLDLSPAERTRLHAHATWLASDDIKLTGLKKRLDTLTPKQRQDMGRALVTIASIDGVITPGEVTTLTRIYRLLGLNPDLVTSQLHAELTQSPPTPARDPVVVRSAAEPETGFHIPPRPETPAHPAKIGLDAEAIKRKLAQSAEISTLLARIFAEPDDLEETPHPQVSTQQKEGEIPGLDRAHSELFKRVAAQSEWSQAEFAELCAELGLMPAGAIDTVNESAYDISGEPLLEGDGTISVNPYALKEMRK
jgi:uncharacterized tellurite resistance protein B-like protein